MVAREPTRRWARGGSIGRIHAAAATMLGVLATLVMPLTSGVWWTILAGGRVVDERALRFTDDDASQLAIAGGSWVVQPWLPAVAHHVAWTSGGIALVSVLAALLGGLTTLLLYLLARRQATPGAALAAVVLGWVMLIPNPLRTESWAALVAVSLLHLMLERGWWWTVPLAAALWANVHGSFPLVLAIALGAAIGCFPGARVLGVGLLRRVAWVVACGAATLLTPLGAEGWRYVADVTGAASIESVTTAWQPLEPTGTQALLAIALVLVATRGMVKRIVDGVLTWGGAMLVLAPAWGFLALSLLDARRNLVWMSIALVPVLAATLGDIAVRRGVGDGGERREGDAGQSRAAMVILIAAAIGVVVVWPWSDRRGSVALVGMPSETMLRTIDGTETVFASAEWADYVRLRTGARVVVDARLERYRAADIERYADAIDGDVSHIADADVLVIRRRTASDLEDALVDSSGCPWQRLVETGRGSTWRRMDACQPG